MKSILLLGVMSLVLFSCNGPGNAAETFENDALAEAIQRGEEVAVLQALRLQSVRKFILGDDETSAIYEARMRADIPGDSGSCPTVTIRLRARYPKPSWQGYAWKGMSRRMLPNDYTAVVLVDNRQVCTIEQSGNPLMQCQAPIPGQADIWVRVDASTASSGFDVTLFRLTPRSTSVGRDAGQELLLAKGA